MLSSFSLSLVAVATVGIFTNFVTQLLIIQNLKCQHQEDKRDIKHHLYGKQQTWEWS